MKTFRVELFLNAHGSVEVQAESRTEAVRIAMSQQYHGRDLPGALLIPSEAIDVEPIRLAHQPSTLNPQPQ